MLLSVVIPCYNELDTLDEIINAVNKAPYAQKEIIIVDDFSTDGTREALKNTIENTNHALMQANIILDKINRGEGSAGKLLKNDSLYLNLNKSAQDLDKLMKDIRINPDRYLHFSVFGKKNKPIALDK